MTMRHLAEATDYNGLIAAIRNRAAELQVAGETLDEISGLPNRYCAKLIGARISKNGSHRRPAQSHVHEQTKGQRDRPQGGASAMEQAEGDGYQTQGTSSMSVSERIPIGPDDPDEVFVLEAELLAQYAEPLHDGGVLVANFFAQDEEFRAIERRGTGRLHEFVAGQAAAARTDPTSPTGAAVRDYTEQIGTEQKNIKVDSITAQAQEDEANAAYLRSASSTALLSGDIGAFAGGLKALSGAAASLISRVQPAAVIRA